MMHGVAAVVAAVLAFQGGPPRPGVVEPVAGERIAWFGTWEAGLAEAKRTNRPILLVSAAPHCHGVPGIW
jgi:hypothetical protein